MRRMLATAELATIFPMSSVLAFDGAWLKERAKSIAVEAQACAKQMSGIGFAFDEIHTEIDLTPKIDIFFRDVGGPVGGPVPATITGPCRGLAQMLLAAREVRYAGFRPKGVRISFPALKAVLIHTAAP